MDGLIVVRTGQVCQIAPSGLPLATDLSIAFKLCGSLAVAPTEQERSGRQFFVQLEFVDDPLGFVHVSSVVHGFLSQDFIPTALAELRKMKQVAALHQAPGRRAVMRVKAAAPSTIAATTIQRGGFFCACSSWIPPRHPGDGSAAVAVSHGVSCAKSALVTCSSAEVLFVSSSDLSESLSVAARTVLHRNMQRAASAASSTMSAPAAAIKSKKTYSWTEEDFHPPLWSNDMLTQRANETQWANYKRRLLRNILQDKRNHQQRQALPFRRDAQPEPSSRHTRANRND